MPAASSPQALKPSTRQFQYDHGFNPAPPRCASSAQAWQGFRPDWWLPTGLCCCCGPQERDSLAQHANLEFNMQKPEETPIQDRKKWPKAKTRKKQSAEEARKRTTENPTKIRTKKKNEMQNSGVARILSKVRKKREVLKMSSKTAGIDISRLNRRRWAFDMLGGRGHPSSLQSK